MHAVHTGSEEIPSTHLHALIVSIMTFEIGRNKGGVLNAPPQSETSLKRDRFLNTMFLRL